MATAYTSLLGLALPVTGELDGTWGDTVNNYITSYLDAAVEGTQTISGSQTAVTLSVTNGTALSQAGTGSTGSAQYAVINCTGNPAGLLTITAPASSRQYMIINATSTSQSVKIVGSGPTTGVTLVSGEKAIVAWNGSDFVKVASTSISVLTGTLPVANGGTGLTTIAALSIPVANVLNTYTTVTPSAGQSIRINAGGTAWEAYTPSSSSGTVTSVAQSFTGGLISVAGSPITSSGTLALTVAGTSGGIPYFSSASTWATSAALTANALVIGGGAGAAPSTTTTGTGVLTALGNNANAALGFITGSGTATLSNKRIDPRNVVATSASSVTPDVSAGDIYAFTALAATLTINAPIGTPTDGDKLMFRILDNGSSQTLSWNATYTEIGVTLPTSTTANKTTYVGCIYNANNTRWDVIAVTTQA